MSPLEALDLVARRDLPALHLEPGGAEDRVLSFAELHDTVRRRAARLRTWSHDVHSGPGPAPVLAVDAHRGALLLIELLAAFEAGLPALALNNGWWPRERDAVLEQVRPGWMSGGDPGQVPTPVGLGHSHALRPDASAAVDAAWWLASTGSDGDPTPYVFDRGQVSSWMAPGGTLGGDLKPGSRVLVTGEVAHAPVLRMALSALAHGAEVQITDRTHFGGLLAHGHYDQVVTTPVLLRRTLRQLQRRQRRLVGVSQLSLHQGPVRPHEQVDWPQRFSGSVRSWLSATEAGGWLLQDGHVPEGLEVRLDSGGTMHTSGPQSAQVSARQPRPAGGWPSGDQAETDAAGRTVWQGRLRDHFRVDATQVNPVVVEAVLAAHPLVAEIAVAPRPHPERGNQVVAVLVPADPEWPPFLEDLAAVAASLPPECRPEVLTIVEDIPTNAAGALHRRLVNYEEASR